MNEILCPELIADSLGSKAWPKADISLREKRPDEAGKIIPTWEILKIEMGRPEALRLEVIPGQNEVDIHKSDAFGISTDLNLTDITGVNYQPMLVEFSNHHFVAKLHRNGHLTLSTND